MKAIVYTKYGSPDVLTLQEVPKPVPKADEVLVKIHAASINSWDWDMLRGEPIVIRLWGLLKPRYTIPGADIAGRVEAVGTGVHRFKPGDEVFGDLCECGWGGFAEYACVRDDALVLKPNYMTFEQAAATPQAGLMALQSILVKGKLKPRQSVLINGAGGGVGTFAIQISKSIGAEVTAVDTGVKLSKLISLGADHVIDYQKEDFTRNGRGYDLIIDVVANRSISQYKASLNPGGTFLMIGGTMSAIFQALFLSRLISMFGNKKLGLFPYHPNQGLEVLIELFKTGKAVPVIDKTFSLQETAEAFRYYAAGNFVGKIIITM